MLVALAGGVGAARFLRGLVRVHPPADLLVIGNTGDDLRLHGLAVSPDLDSVAYTLAGLADEERGWGLAGETWNVLEAIQRLGEPSWFALGDRDIATHLLRTRLLADGASLSQATAELCGRLGVPVRLVPMSDQPVQTRVQVQGPDGPEDLGFQEYWVARRARDPVLRITFAGIERARPAPGLLDAIAAADGIILCPSNPVVSVAPILAVPGIRAAIQNVACRTVAVTPIVGGAPVRGMADKLLPAWGVEVSARGVAGLYSGLADAFVLDQVDGEQARDIAELGLEPIVAPTLMHTVEDAAALAKIALDALGGSGGLKSEAGTQAPGNQGNPSGSLPVDRGASG
ncbi:MAG TPA: 2-phospho-L-lactate transferase [Actinomycetota bacterium]|jgi:LPPG:FO 2-phospho-L-lactate transferase|nr:2-phospho-L-lactate transferase [Actinomycetota bacterium]